jgi:hypothetical protein
MGRVAVIANAIMVIALTSASDPSLGQGRFEPMDQII